MTTEREGWSNVGGLTRRYHYFRKSRSLCGRWGVFSTEILQAGKDNSPDNCAECRRKRAKELQEVKSERL